MDDRLREIEERASKASPGPWYARPEYHINGGVVPHRDVLTESANPDEADKRIAEVFGPNDFDFIAHARDDILYLLQQVRGEREENARLSRVIANAAKYLPVFMDADLATIRYMSPDMRTAFEALIAEARAALGGKP